MTMSLDDAELQFLVDAGDAIVANGMNRSDAIEFLYDRFDPAGSRSVSECMTEMENRRGVRYYIKPNDAFKYKAVDLVVPDLAMAVGKGMGMGTCDTDHDALQSMMQEGKNTLVVRKMFKSIAGDTMALGMVCAAPDDGEVIGNRVVQVNTIVKPVIISCETIQLLLECRLIELWAKVGDEAMFSERN
jgi:hypothetical protein